MYALTHSAQIQLLLGNYEATNALADEAVALAEEKRALLWKLFGIALKLYVLSLSGQASKAAQIITENLNLIQPTGARVWRPYVRMQLATAYSDVGQFDEARREAFESLAEIENYKERWWEAEVNRMAGEIARKSSHTGALKAEVYFDRALTVARQQQAKSWELRAAMSMARLWRDQGKRDEARDLLAPVYGWFTEGFDTLDLKEAKALLDELTSCALPTQPITEWLAKIGLERYAGAFADNDIDASVLRHLTDADLEKIGVSLGHRRKMLAAIAELGNAPAPATAPVLASEIASPAITPPVESAAERRQVTVMFCDLVGSTALSVRMDPEDLREVISAYHECVAETVQRFGGFVAKYMGDGVLVYFGYPQAHEDDAERAVRAGLELITAVAALKTHAPLQTRIGIATGLVVVGDLIGTGAAQEQAVVGETPNIAARLQSVAEPNTVVIAESTRKLLGNLFDLRDLGEQDLKGIGGRVRAWAALRPASVESRFEALRASGLSAFVGREHGLEMLERGLNKARSELCVIDVAAEPGMGKSRLAYEFRRRISRERAFILSGNCSADGQKTPLLPFIEVVRGAFRVSVGEAEKDVEQKLEMGLTTLGLYSSRSVGLLLNLLVSRFLTTHWLDWTAC
jgi:class 3 adenylate cyclase